MESRGPCLRREQGLTLLPLPSRFPSFTERNDQTEQEERREIKQRLTRKVLGLSTLSAECDSKRGREGAGLAQARRAATRASPHGPECGFPGTENAPAGAGDTVP